MFSGRENPRGTANVHMQNMFAQIFERKRRIIEQVKQQADLFDQHLVSKCLLAGVSPPSWLLSPSLPSQTSELNKEEVISGLLFPQSRPSIVCPSGSLSTYQQPVSFLADNVVRQDLTSVVNNPLEEQLLEEEEQHHLAHSLVRRVSSHSHEQDANIAFPRDVHVEERLVESVSVGCREIQSCPSPVHSQNQRVENSLDATSPGRSQEIMVPKSVSTTGCERKPSSLGYCHDEIEPNTCLDPELPVPLDKFQRSKSRQKDLERRSSAKASKSRSNCRNELKPFPGGNIGLEIASLRSDVVSAINLLKLGENGEDITRGDQSNGKGECVDTNICSSAGRDSQTDVSTDEKTLASAIGNSISKTELLGFVESSSVELQWRHSVMQSDDESVLLKPVTVTGEALLVEEDKAGESIEVSIISKSRSLSQTDITAVEQVVVESILQESGTPEGSNQCHGILSRPRSSVIEEESANGYKALAVGSDLKSSEEQLKVRSRNVSLKTHDLPDFVKPESPYFNDNGERSFHDIPMNSQEKSTMGKALTPASAARVSDVPSLTDSEVNLSANNETNGIEDHNGLEKEIVSAAESPASHTGLRVGENEPTESYTFTGQKDLLKKRLQLGTSSDKGVSPVNRNPVYTEIGESHGRECSIQKIFCSSSSIDGSQLQNKQRRTLDKLTSREPSSSPRGDIFDSDSVRETVRHSEEAACHNLNHYDVELQKLIGSAPSNHYEVELQKMIGSASSAELRFKEGYLFKEAGLMSPASPSFRPEQLSVERSHIAPNQGLKTENMDFLLDVGEISYPFAGGVVRGSDCSPCLSPLGLTGAGDGSPPDLEGFIIQTDDESQSSSKKQIKHNSFQLPRTTAESATIIKKIHNSACRTTPSLHLAKTLKFNGKLDMDQSVSTVLLEGSSAAAKNPCTSPAGKLWYRSLQKSSSSEKRGSQTPDLPSISEEPENVDEEPENLCANTPNSMRSEKRGSSIPDLPCIAEENEKEDEISEAVDEVSDSKSGNVSAEKKPLAGVSEDPMKFLSSVSKAKIPVDRQSLDSVNTAFSFSTTCNNSVKSKAERKKSGNRRFTGKGKENACGAAGTGRNVKPPSSRFSKAKLSCNSTSTTVGPRLPEKEPRHNNIVSNITSFVPLVQQQKPAAAIVTGKRDVKVKALEAAEATKRIAEQKENERKMKKEAMKLERARLEQENLRKQEMEKKKREEERKKKEAERAWKQEIEKKKKEEERKRKESEMADKKRQREEEKKLKEAKRQRVVEMQRQQKEADEKLQADKGMKRQAMDAKIKALKELKEEQGNARIREVRSKSNSSNDTNASRSSREDDFKVISNPGKMSEESYDISPYKCSDDEDDEEDDEDDMSNHKFVPSWASKSNMLVTVISQQNSDPDITFPAKSFRNITQVLKPRKFRTQTRRSQTQIQRQ